MDRKYIGKRAEPTVEELEFIYSRIGQMSDKAILEEMQDTTFPVRSPGFITRRRREFSTAKKILEIELKKELDPIIVERRKQHFDDMVLIIRLIIKGLDKLSHTQLNGRYEIYEEGSPNKKLNRDQIIAILEGNLSAAYQKHGDWNIDNNLLSHISAEYPAMQDLFGFISKNPTEFIDIIRTLVARKTFKGICPVCKDW